MCALGSLNANVFATGILCVAASDRGYFPKVLANLHISAEEDEMSYYEKTFAFCPGLVRDGIFSFARKTSTLRMKKNVPT